MSRVIHKAKSLGRVSGAGWDNTFRILIPTPLLDFNCFSFYIGKIIDLWPLTLLPRFSSNLQNFIQITIMFKMFINVSTQRQNSTVQGPFGTSLFQWVVPSLGSRPPVFLVGAGLPKNYLHWRQFIMWPTGYFLPWLWTTRVLILFLALTLGIPGKSYNLCVKYYW